MKKPGDIIFVDGVRQEILFVRPENPALRGTWEWEPDQYTTVEEDGSVNIVYEDQLDGAEASAHPPAGREEIL